MYRNYIENKELWALFCQVDVPPVNLPESHADQQKSSQSSEEMPGTKQTLEKCTKILYLNIYFCSLNYFFLKLKTLSCF